MTKYVCSHHFWGLIWIAFGCVLVCSIVLTGLVVSHPVARPSIDLPSSQFGPLFESYLNYKESEFLFYCFIAIFFLMNLIGIYFLNEKYNWIGLRECTRK
jgi:hypothetical protein